MTLIVPNAVQPCKALVHLEFSFCLAVAKMPQDARALCPWRTLNFVNMKTTDRREACAIEMSLQCGVGNGDHIPIPALGLHHRGPSEWMV
jgi:hypothetical protein